MTEPTEHPPTPRVCLHGQLRRSCTICELMEQIAEKEHALLAAQHALELERIGYGNEIREKDATIEKLTRERENQGKTIDKLLEIIEQTSHERDAAEARAEAEKKRADVYGIEINDMAKQIAALTKKCRCKLVGGTSRRTRP